MIGPFRPVLIGQQNSTTTGKNSKRIEGNGGLSKQTTNTHRGKRENEPKQESQKKTVQQKARRKKAQTVQKRAREKRHKQGNKTTDDRGKAHAKGKNKRGNTRRENVR